MRASETFTELYLQTEETPPRIHPLDGFKGCRVSCGGEPCLLLADAEDRGSLVLAHACEGLPPHLEQGNVESEVAGLLDLR